jgi:hypothetical protein
MAHPPFGRISLKRDGFLALNEFSGSGRTKKGSKIGPKKSFQSLFLARIFDQWPPSCVERRGTRSLITTRRPLSLTADTRSATATPTMCLSRLILLGGPPYRLRLEKSRFLGFFSKKPQKTRLAGMAHPPFGRISLQRYVFLALNYFSGSGRTKKGSKIAQ